EEADRNHDAEREEHRDERRPVGRLDVLETWKEAVWIMCQHQRGAARYRDRKPVGFGRRVRPGEDMEVAGLAAVPMRLHGGNLDRLVLERVEAVQIAEQHLQWREDHQ